MNIADEYRAAARAEICDKLVNQAKRMFWIPAAYKKYEIQIGLEVVTEQDLEHVSHIDITKFLDQTAEEQVQSDLLDLIMISNSIYKYIAYFYTDREIKIEITSLNQPVFSTTFNSKPF